ncbi:hypothetical protein V8F20_001267 [Naviculisporaceae sp. PSN 640]
MSENTPRSRMTPHIPNPVGDLSDKTPIEKWFTRDYSRVPAPELSGRIRTQEALRARLIARARASKARTRGNTRYKAILKRTVPSSAPDPITSRPVPDRKFQGVPQFAINDNSWGEGEEGVFPYAGGESGNEADCELSTDDDEELDDYEVPEEKVSQFLAFQDQLPELPVSMQLSSRNSNRAFHDVDSGNDADDEGTTTSKTITKPKRRAENAEDHARKRSRRESNGHGPSIT